MSDILEAMRRSGGAGDDFGARIREVDRFKLFPAPRAAQIAEFGQLVNELIGLHNGSTGLVVVFAAASRGEGTSFVSYNVARQMCAMLDRRIAWVDGNFDRPQPGLEDGGNNLRRLLKDPASWGEFPISDSLTVVPNGDLRIKTTDLLKSASYQQILEGFRKTFMFTIIDASAFLESVDVAHLAAPTDGLVVVVESRRLKHEVIKHGMDRLRSLDVEVLGAVLNRRTYDIPQSLYQRL